MDKTFAAAEKRLKNFYPNLKINWERKVDSRRKVMHAINRDNGKTFMFVLYHTGGFTDYQEVEN